MLTFSKLLEEIVSYYSQLIITFDTNIIFRHDGLSLHTLKWDFYYNFNFLGKKITINDRILEATINFYE